MTDSRLDQEDRICAGWIKACIDTLAMLERDGDTDGPLYGHWERAYLEWGDRQHAVHEEQGARIPA